MSKFLFRLLLLFSPILSFSQECVLIFSGEVLDESTAIPLPYANIFIEEIGFGQTSDSLGRFSLPSLCPGDYHIRFSHIGCESERFFFRLQRDTIFSIFLHHHTELLDEVVVHGSKGENATQMSNTLDEGQITEKSNENLAEVLTQIAGVSSLKNGSGISKPVIHGLYGNRIAILNNGIAQSGQQWGNDHSPEIDPMVADHISVVKGAGVLAYNGTSLGGLVLIEPHLHGKANYIFQSNGLGNTLNLQLEKYGKFFAWRTIFRVIRPLMKCIAMAFTRA